MYVQAYSFNYRVRLLGNNLNEILVMEFQRVIKKDELEKLKTKFEGKIGNKIWEIWNEWMSFLYSRWIGRKNGARQSRLFRNIDGTLSILKSTL